MGCPTGQMREIISFGIIPRDGINNDACLPNPETEQCEGSYNKEDLQEAIYEK